MLLLRTSTPKALLGENDVPGIPKIFMATSIRHLVNDHIPEFPVGHCRISVLFPQFR
jgi:hypothetical protein